MPPFAIGDRSAVRVDRQEGRHIFTDELMRFAERVSDPRLTAVIEHLQRPVHVAVRGRAGVGRGAVARALGSAGLVVGDGDADVVVVVVAEAVKPEDRALLDGSAPSLMALNKADLLRVGGRRRAAQCRAVTGVPTVPMIALLADVALDEELIAALRVLVGGPELTSVDAFLCGDHRLPFATRARLLETLDRFGIANAAAALERGVDPASLPEVLRRLSGIDDVVAQLEAVAAPVRYERVRAAIRELQALAVQSDRVASFLSADDTVLAVMAAAVDVVEADGLQVDRGDDPAAHLRRAVHWRRFSRGPVSPLHRSCGADISRGSLRLLGRGR